MTGLLISTNWKSDSYNIIFIIVDCLTKIVHYEPVKTILEAVGQAKIIINMLVRYHGFLKSIISNQDLLFTLKFWFLLYYFFSIKQKFSTIFYLQTNGQPKRQNSMMEAYLCIFINYEQNDQARFLPIAEFVYIKTKNTSIGYKLFKLNCNYYLRISFEDKVNPHSKFRSANKLTKELKKLISIYQQNLFYT